MAIKIVYPLPEEIEYIKEAGETLNPFAKKIALDWSKKYLSDIKKPALTTEKTQKIFNRQTTSLFSTMASGEINKTLKTFENFGNILQKERVSFDELALIIHFLEEAYYPYLLEHFKEKDLLKSLNALDHLLHNGFGSLSFVYFHNLQRASNRLDALLQITEVGISSLSLEQLLHELIKRMVFLTKANAGIIWITDEEREIIIPRTNVGIDDKYMPHFTMKVGQYLAGTIAKKGVPLTLIDLPIPQKAQIYIEEQQIKSMLGVPLKIGDKVIGVARLDYKKERKFKKIDIELFQVLADRASRAIENARLYKQQEEIATVLQKSLRSAEPPLINIDIGVYYHSATQAALVGGDFYDFIDTPEELHVIIGDVSGKGITAAMDGAMVKQAYKMLINQYEPRKLMAELNNFISDQLPSGKFITTALITFDKKTKELTIVNAGHYSPLIFDTKKGYGYFPNHQKSLAIGIFKNEKYRSSKIKLKENELIILYTDGLIEARHNSLMYGQNGLYEAAKKFSSLKAQNLANAIAENALSFAGGLLSDDLAIITIKT